MRYAVVLSALIALQNPQEKTPTREEIATELEKRFAALGPVYVRAIVESVDVDGLRSVRNEVEIHFRPGESWTYAIVRDVHGGSHETFRLYEKDETFLSWEAGKEAERIDNGAYYKWRWKTQFELDAELARILGAPAESKTIGEFTARVKPELVLDLRAEALDKPRSHVRASMDRSPGGGASWIQMFRWASLEDVVVTADEVIARFPAAGHETVIDRKTGFLKSVGNNFITGDRRILTVKEVKPVEKKPEVKKPSRSRTRRPGGDDLAGAYGQVLHGYFHECLDKVLANWGVAGSPEKTEPLRNFFTMVAARREALTEDGWHRSWTEAWLKNQRQGGRTLEEIIKNFDKCVQELKEYIEGGDNENHENFRERTEQFKQSLQRKVQEAPAVEEAKNRLSKRIEESFDRDRLDKARSKLPPPDYKGMLREAIEEARTKK